MAEYAVTHQGTFSLSASPKDLEDRIFSGGPSPVVLTVEITSPPVNSAVEVLVDGRAISDGLLTVVGAESRTFRIEKARTIDLVLRNPGSSAAGSYTLSVLL